VDPELSLSYPQTLRARYWFPHKAVDDLVKQRPQWAGEGYGAAGRLVPAREKSG